MVTEPNRYNTCVHHINVKLYSQARCTVPEAASLLDVLLHVLRLEVPGGAVVVVAAEEAEEGGFVPNTAVMLPTNSLLFSLSTHCRSPSESSTYT